MELSDFNLWSFSGFLLLSVILVFALLRKFVFGIFDPWIWIIVNQSVMLTYVIYEFFQNRLHTLHLIYWCVALLSFSIGFHLVKQSNILRLSWLVPTRFFIILLIVSISTYQILGDSIFILLRGLPTKLEPGIYGGGFGVIKYIHDANTIVLAILIFLSFFLYGLSWYICFGFIALLYPMIYLEWGKSGLINLLFVFTSIKFFLNTNKKPFNRIQISVAVVTVGLFVVYKFLAVAESGYAETPIDAILKRAINTADSVYYYFVLDAQAKFDTPLNLVSFIFAQVSPHFGYIDDLAQRVGVLLPEYALGQSMDGYGPSAPFQIIGHLAYGFFGFIYAFIVGVTLGKIKHEKLFTKNILYFMIIYTLAPILAGDASLFMYYIVCIFAILPPILFSSAVALAISPSGDKLFATYSLAVRH
jgi:hypothetical protein